MGRAVKRTIDLLVGVVLLGLTLPVILGFALATASSSRGGPFYSQERLTFGGRRFRIYKLRTMRSDAEPGGIPRWPEEHDPRITPLGRFLRRFWIDELPQLLNVLRGELSLIGPRPERPFFVEAFSARMPKYPLRHHVKAGISGLSQVEGFTGNTSLERRLHLDLRYIRNWSPALDFCLMLRTVSKALKRPRIRASP